MGRAPLLGIFFWFFGIRRSEKVSWTSLSNMPGHPLLRPFRESYKFFKDRFFRVYDGRVGSNLLVDSIGNLHFPFSWTKGPAMVVKVDKASLESLDHLSQGLECCLEGLWIASLKVLSVAWGGLWTISLKVLSVAWEIYSYLIFILSMLELGGLGRWLLNFNWDHHLGAKSQTEGSFICSRMGRSVGRSV
ncbi:hypothetical protein CR513_52718, partial [Mucuna pruriens]